MLSNVGRIAAMLVVVMRPSDFSVTRWSLPAGPRGPTFWWNMLSTPKAAEYNPTAYLKKRLAQWRGGRPAIITCLIHENNFYRRRSTPWASIYYADVRKSRPRKPPYNLKAPDASLPRLARDQKAIWKAYEQLVAYAAANLKVVTSQDIMTMAEAARQPNAVQERRGPLEGKTPGDRPPQQRRRALESRGHRTKPPTP